MFAHNSLMADLGLTVFLILFGGNEKSCNFAGEEQMGSSHVGR